MFKRNPGFLVLTGLCLFTVCLIAFSGCKEAANNLPLGAVTDANVQTIVLAELGSGSFPIIGNVKAKGSGQPLANISTFLYYNGYLLNSTKTTSEGKFFCYNLPPALYDLRFEDSARIYGSATLIVRILPDGKLSPEKPEVALQEIVAQDATVRYFSIKGRLKTNDAAKAGIPYEMVRLLGTSSQEISATVSASDGTFEFLNLRPSSYTLEAAAKSYLYKQKSSEIRLLDNGTVVPYPELLLDPVDKQIKATIKGVVRLGSQEPVNLLPVLLKEKGTTIYTTADGSFFFDGLPAGFYTMDVDPAESRFSKQTVGVQILSDGTVVPSPVTVTMNPKSTKIETYVATGTIVDAFSGGPLEYVTCNLVGKNSTITDRNGTFSFSGLGSGSYQLKFTKLGFNDLSVGFSIVQVGSTIQFVPSTLNFSMVYNQEGGKGSIVGRYVNETTREGQNSAIVRVYEMRYTTKLTDEKVTVNGLEKVYESHWEFIDRDPQAIKSTHSSRNDLATPEDEGGAFKITHLSPTTDVKKYFVFVGKDETDTDLHTYEWTAPGSVGAKWNFPLSGNYYAWSLIDITSGISTYLTNYDKENY